jgi:SAM-dependent methyltransferase
MARGPEIRQQVHSSTESAAGPFSAATADGLRQPLLPEVGYTIKPFLDISEIKALKLLYGETTPVVPCDFYHSVLGTNVETKHRIFEGIAAIVKDKLSRLAPGYQLLLASFVTKKAGSTRGRLRIHQDNSFVNPDENIGINMWVPLSDVNQSNACLRIVEYSQRFGHINATPSNPSPYNTVLSELEARYLRDLPMEAGSACVFDSRVLHATEENQTGRDRIAIYLNLVPENVTPLSYVWSQEKPESLEVYKIDTQFLLNLPPGQPLEESLRERGIFAGTIGYAPANWSLTDLVERLPIPKSSGTLATADASCPVPAAPAGFWSSIRSSLAGVFVRGLGSERFDNAVTTPEASAQKQTGGPIRDARLPIPSQDAVDVKHYYEERTAAYIEGFGDVFQGSRPASTTDLLDYILRAADINDGMKVLDAGCGVCGPAIWFAQHRDVRIESLTISPVQVRSARARVAAQGLENRITVREGDFHQLTDIYPRDSFDRVLFLETICHASDYRLVLKQAMEVLKPGGFLYVKDFYCQDYRSRPDMIETQLEDLKALNRVYHLSLPDLTSTVDLICELGFRFKYLREPSYLAVFEPWMRFEQMAGLAWNPRLSHHDLIACMELFCQRPLEQSSPV